MSEEEMEEKEYLWVLMHDPFLRHFSLELSVDSTITPDMYMESLVDLVNEFKDRPEDLFEMVDSSNIINTQ